MNPHLEELIRIIHKNKIKTIKVFTHGFKIERLEPFVKYISNIILSNHGNLYEDRLSLFKSIFGDKLYVSKKEEHFVLPNNLLNIPEKVICNCPGINLCDGKIYSCAPIQDLIIRFPHLNKRGTSTKVEINYMDHLWHTYKNRTKHCNACVGNLSVVRYLKKIHVNNSTIN